ncbi:hypothetical protein [Streptomyces sp. NPDC002566]|uniref:hypothetical protein n=1 Tax=Streptomyces sp. NPDC002566 TaxID=3364650 RepID=UPI0036AABA3A
MTDPHTLYAGLTLAGELAAKDDGSNFTAYFNTLLIVGITTIIVIRQFTAQQVTNRMFFWVAVLIVRGCVPPGPAEMKPASIALLVLSLFASVAFGLWRGAAFPMWRDAEGRVFRKGDRRILFLWLLTVAARLVFGGIGAVAFHEPFNADALWLGMGVTLAVQHLVMTRRKAGAPLRVADGGAVPAAR